MKNTKKFAAMIAALTLSACSIAPMFSFAYDKKDLSQDGQNAYDAYVAENGDITVDNWLALDGNEQYIPVDQPTEPTAPTAEKDKIKFTGEQAGTHSYKVYRIFAGEAAANGMNETTKAELSNITWDTAVNTNVQAALLTALKADNTLKDDFASVESISDAVAFSKVIAGYEANSAKAKAFAETVIKVFNANSVVVKATGDSKAGVSLTEDGYYVIAETDVTTENDAYTGMTAYLLGVYKAEAGAVVTVKSSAPSFQKKLKDTNDSVANSTTDWQDSADYDINDDVPFQLKATLPTTYKDYKAYKLTFHDNFRNKESGEEVFDFKKIDKVYVDVDNSGTFNDGDVEITDYDSKQNATTEKDGATYNMEVTIDNLKTLYNPDTLPEGASVIVEYTATLNENAVIGAAGNWNDAYLTYTSNPNWSGNPDNEDTPDEEKEKPKDSTVDTNVVFTYQTVIDKINPQGTKLTGATFVLGKKYATAPANGTEMSSGATTFEGYYPVKTIEGTNTSTFEFKGLDDGDYILLETKAPDNYKIATKPVFFTITATHTQDTLTEAEEAAGNTILTLTSLTGAGTNGNETTDGFINLQMQKDNEGKDLGKITSKLTEGEIDASFINTSGSELPSTGGIGTKIFYLGGGAMVAVAGIFLITKKRMGKEEN